MKKQYFSKDFWLVAMMALVSLNAVFIFTIVPGSVVENLKLVSPASSQQMAQVAQSLGVTITVTNDDELRAALLQVKGGETIKLAPGTYSDVGIHKKVEGQTQLDRITVGAKYVLNATPVLSAPVVITSADINNRSVVKSMTISNSSYWRIENLSFRPSPKKTAFTAKDSAVVFNRNDIAYGDAATWTDEDWLNNTGIAVAVAQLNASIPRAEITNNYMKNINFGLVLNGYVTARNNYITDFKGDGIRANSNVLIENNYITNPHRVDGNHMDGFQSFTKGEDGKVGTGVNSNTVLRNNSFVLQSSSTSMQGIGMFDGYFKNWTIENNLIITNHAHGISVYGAIDSVIRNNAAFTYSTETYGSNRSYIRFFNHKNGTPTTNSRLENNISGNPLVSREGVTVVSHTQIALSDYDKYFVDYKNHDFTIKPNAIPFSVGATIDFANLAPEPYAPVLPKPIITFGANVATATPDSMITINWNVEHAQSCQAGGSWSGTKAVTGSESIKLPATVGIATYTLTCINGANSETASVAVSVVSSPRTTSTGTVQDSTCAVGQANCPQKNGVLEVGDKIVTIQQTPVRAEPSLTLEPFGKRKIGITGTLLKGPQTADRTIWWFVDFDTGSDGWVEARNISER